MKKILLGTTALVAAGFAVQQAQAADPIKMTVGGYDNWGIYYASNSNNPGTATIPAEPGFNKGDHSLAMDARIDFKGSTVLDNGIEVGSTIQLKGGAAAIDRTYVWLKGSFGTLRIGNDKTAAYNLSTAAPYVSYFFGANSPTVYANGLSQFFGQSTGLLRSRFAAGEWATFSTFPMAPSRNGQLEYFSPVFNGFQFGASYAPDGGKITPGTEYLLPVKTSSSTNPAFGPHGPVYSAGLRYDGNLGGLGVTAEVGWVRMTDKASSFYVVPSHDSDTWNGGLVLSYGQFSFGGSYMDQQDAHNVQGTHTKSFDLGAKYTSSGPWSTGVYWLHETINTDPGVLVAAGNKDTMDSLRLQGGYTLGPGVDLTGALGHDAFKDGVAGKTYNSTMVAAGILVSF